MTKGIKYDYDTDYMCGQCKKYHIGICHKYDVPVDFRQGACKKIKKVKIWKKLSAA